MSLSEFFRKIFHFAQAEKKCESLGLDLLVAEM
jgi:hypothetical protein